VIIARAGRPVARLTRLAVVSKKKRRLGLLDGRFKIPEDFNRALPDEVLKAFEGE
jgi:antitoxin (DNA-binding transcriptional repressor) of toxin-antitoxin stability system